MQVVLERMIPELQDLQERGIFTEVSTALNAHSIKSTHLQSIICVCIFLG